MRILYDGWIYGKQPLGGVSRYFNNIISRLPSDWFPFLVTKNCQTIQPPSHSRLQHFKFKGRPGPIGKWPELGDRLSWFQKKKLLILPCQNIFLILIQSIIVRIYILQ